MHRRARSLFWLTAFAVAMAHVEAMIVVYLRELYYPDHPLSVFPLRLMSEHHLRLELAREVATVVMILSVAVLAERGVMRIFAGFVYAFGLWDILYYVWLKIGIGWPAHWVEWDVLFLIPWPWFGPWIAPAAIAALFVIWGGWILATERQYRLTAAPASLFIAGALFALAAFLQPGFALLAQGPAGFRGYEPGGFEWGLYMVGYTGMLAGMALSLRRRGG